MYSLRPLLSGLALFLMLWLSLCALLLLFFWTWPRTLTGWLVLLGVGPIFYLMFDAVAEILFWPVTRLWPNSTGNQDGTGRTAAQRSSLLRIALLLVYTLFVAGVAVLIIFDGYELVGGRIEAIEEFLSRHFW